MDKNEKKIAGIYARVSTKEQADSDNSIPAQIEGARKWASDHGFIISENHVYKDAGQSAKTIDRPHFKKMLVDSGSNPSPFDAILIYDQSRFSRDLLESLFYEHQLTENGVEVIYYSENTYGIDPETKFLQDAMKKIIAHYDNMKRATSTKLAQVINAKRGNRNGGPGAYGYDYTRVKVGKVKRGTLVINPIEAEVVRLIFELAAKGEGIKAIAVELNKRGIKTRRGKAWSKTTIANILQRETYIGKTIFNRTDRSDKRRIKMRPKEEWIIVPDTHEPIIDKETFETVQRIKKARSRRKIHPRTLASTYLLSGMMKCSKCGAPYIIESGSVKGRYAYYNCQTYLKKGKQVCGGRRIRADQIEEVIRHSIETKILSNENIERIVEDVKKAIKLLGGASKVKKVNTQKAIRQVEEKLYRYYSAIESGNLFSEDVGERIRELRQEKDRLQNELDSLDRGAHEASRLQLSKRELVRFREEVIQGFLGDNIREKQSFLRHFIDKIIVEPEELRVLYYPPDPKEGLKLVVSNKKGETKSVSPYGNTWLARRHTV